jgi:hypothetical protein
MDWRIVRDALHVLRVQSRKGVRGIPGLDKSTVHRIESTKRRKVHAPELESVEAIVTACGSSLGAFFTKIDHARETLGESQTADVLAALSDEQKARQVIAFLTLDASVRDLLSTTRPRLPAGSAAQALELVDVSKRAPKTGARTKHPTTPRRSSGPRKTGT